MRPNFAASKSAFPDFVCHTLPKQPSKQVSDP